MKFYQSLSHSTLEAEVFAQYLLEQYAPITLFLNKSLNIFYINGNVEKLLKLPRALVQLNIYKMMDAEGSLILANCFKKTLESGKPILYKDYKLKINNEYKFADFYFQEVQLNRIDEQVVMVRVQLHNDPTRKQKFPKLGNGVEVEQEVEKMKKEILQSQKKTQTLMSELEATNEELKSANRELLASNEELISTNEELQSVNEELHTVNNELTSKNQELASTRSDIDNLLKSTKIGTLFLDTRLRIKKFNKAFTKHYALTESDIGRPISDFNSNFDRLKLYEIANEVFHSLKLKEKEVWSKDGSFYLMRVVPYRTTKDLIKGVVVNFLDIDALAKARQKRRLLAKKFEAVFDNSADIVISILMNGVVKNINKALAKYGKEEIIGKKLSEVLPQKEGMKMNTAIKKLIKTKEVQKTELKLSGGRGKESHIYDVVFIPVSIEHKSEKMLKILAVFKDKSQTIRQIANLEQSLNRYKSFMDHARHQIILVDKSGKVSYVNHIFRKNITREMILGKDIGVFFEPELAEKYMSFVSAIFAGNIDENKITLSIKNTDGKVINIDYIGVPITIQGKTRHVATISTKVLEEI